MAMKTLGNPVPDTTTPSTVHLNDLLSSAAAFQSPRAVLSDPDLTHYEKRAILASWASDACAVEERPALRSPPGVDRPVPLAEILEALRELDCQDRAKSVDPYR